MAGDICIENRPTPNELEFALHATEQARSNVEHLESDQHGGHFFRRSSLRPGEVGLIAFFVGAREALRLELGEVEVKADRLVDVVRAITFNPGCYTPFLEGVRAGSRYAIGQPPHRLLAGAIGEHKAFLEGLTIGDLGPATDLMAKSRYMNRLERRIVPAAAYLQGI